MGIILNGRKIGKNKSNCWVACYCKNKAFFTKESLKRRVVLHELYHHLAVKKGLDMP